MKTKRKHPFYALLVLVGIAFVITASAYGVMAVRGTNRSEAAMPLTGLLGFMDRHGSWLLMLEVLLLGLLTIAAMAMDQMGTHRSKSDGQHGAYEETASHEPKHSDKGKVP